MEEETLPMKWVKYPNHYGTFFAFSEHETGPWHFCKCNETPLTNLFELNRRFPPKNNVNKNRLAPLDSLHVPDEIAEISIEHPNDPISAFEFHEKLCHRCNLATPTMRYCHEMYGGRFDQSFGWYTNQSYLRYGVNPWPIYNFLEEICPDNIQALILEFRATHVAYMSETQNNSSALANDEFNTLRKAYNKATRELKNTFVNFTREEFGFRKVGEGWVSETIVFKITQQLLPSFEIVRHHRPEWLEGLELDIYLPDLKIGLEYQGQQHFFPIKAWGGESALKALKERDQRKVEVCESMGIILIHINYTDPLTRRFISGKLEDAGVQLRNQHSTAT